MRYEPKDDRSKSPRVDRPIAYSHLDSPKRVSRNDNDGFTGRGHYIKDDMGRAVRKLVGERSLKYNSAFPLKEELFRKLKTHLGGDTTVPRIVGAIHEGVGEGLVLKLQEIGRSELKKIILNQRLRRVVSKQVYKAIMNYKPSSE